MSDQALLKSKTNKEDCKDFKDSTDRASTDTVTNISQTSSDIRSEKVYKLYKLRWVIWIFFMTSLMASGLGNVGFAAIASIIKHTYGVNDLVITMLVLPFVILFIPFIFPANYIFDHYGICVPVYIASGCLIVGWWVRLLVNTNFYFLIGGQVIMACGQPFILSAPAKIAGIWFGDNERAIATMIGSLAAPMGAVTGYLLPLPLISDNDIPSKTSQEHAESTFFRYVLIQSIVMTALGLPIIFLIKNKPPSPPSESAENSMNTKKAGQLESIKAALQNRDFLLIMASFSAIYCIYTTLGACVGPISEQFHYKSHANSIFGTVFIFAGLFGSFAHAFLLDKFRKFKCQFIMIGVLCILAMCTSTAVIGEGNLYLTSAALAFLGLAQLPIIGVSYSFTAELTYPLNEALTWGLLQLSGSVVASIFTFGVGYILNHKKKYLAFYLMIGVTILGFLPQLFVREKLKKSKAGIKNTSFTFNVGNTSFREEPRPKNNLDVESQSTFKTAQVPTKLK